MLIVGVLDLVELATVFQLVLSDDVGQLGGELSVDVAGVRQESGAAAEIGRTHADLVAVEEKLDPPIADSVLVEHRLFAEPAVMPGNLGVDEKLRSDNPVVLQRPVVGAVTDSALPATLGVVGKEERGDPVGGA